MIITSTGSFVFGMVVGALIAMVTGFICLCVVLYKAGYMKERGETNG